MCTPLIAASMAAQGAGAAINGAQARKQEERTAHAVNKAGKQGLKTQHGFQNHAAGVMKQATTDQSAPIQTRNLALDQARRSGALSGAVSDPGAGGAIPGSAPPVVASEVTRKLADAVTGAKTSGAALGRLGGYDDASLDSSIKLNRAGQDIGAIKNAASGSASLIPGAQSAAANNSYRRPKAFGDLLQLGGKAAALYGMLGTPGLAPGAMGQKTIGAPTRFGDLF